MRVGARPFLHGRTNGQRAMRGSLVRDQTKDKLYLADDYANLDLLNEDYGYLLSLDRLFRG